jgi:hypothetical protein
VFNTVNWISRSDGYVLGWVIIYQGYGKAVTPKRISRAGVGVCQESGGVECRSTKIILKTCSAKMASGEDFLDGLQMFPLSTLLEYDEYGYGVAGFVETLFEDEGNLSTGVELQSLQLEASTFDGIYNTAQVILCCIYYLNIINIIPLLLPYCKLFVSIYPVRKHRTG